MADLLTYLNVTIPTIPVKPVAPTSTDCSFYRPRESVPVLSLGGSTVTPARRRSASPAVTFSPGRTVRQYTKKGEIDYVILDAPVPCNSAINLSTAQQQRARRSQEREAEIAAGAALIEADHQLIKQLEHQAILAKSAARQQLYEFEQRREEAARRARTSDEQQRQLERDIIEKDLQHGLEVEYQLKAHQRQQAQRLADHLTEDMAQNERRRQQKLQEKRQPLNTTLPLQSWGVPIETVRATRDRLKESWQQQIELRNQRQAQMKAAETASTKAVLEQYDRLEANKQDQEMNRRQRQRENIQRYYEAVQRTKAERLRYQQTAKQAEVEARLSEEREAENYRHQSATQNRRRAQSRNEEMRNEIERRAKERTERRKSDSDHQRKLDELTNTVPQMTLLRCPVTGLLLPPSCFNIIVKDR